MIRSLTFFLATLVLMHAIFGCCIHHAHACEADCCDTPTAMAAKCPCDGHDEQLPLPSQSIQAAGHEHSDHQCEGTSCNAVVMKPQDDDDDSISNLLLAVDDCVTETTTVLNIADTFTRQTFSDVASTALRLHLVLSVLLI